MRPSGLVTLIALAAAPAAEAQYVISVIAGYIHQVEGEVYLEGKPIAPQPDEIIHLRDGERLRSGAGRAELMLTPGSFLRLGPDSEIEMIYAGLLDGRLRLHRGIAVADFPTLYDQESFTIFLGDAEITLRKAGTYRFEALPPAPPRLAVFAGRAEIALADNSFDVKAKQSALLESSQPHEKFDPKKSMDELDRWSAERSADLLAKAEAARKADPNLAASDHANRMLLDLMLRRPSYRSSQRPQSPPQKTGGDSGGGGNRGR